MACWLILCLKASNGALVFGFHSVWDTGVAKTRRILHPVEHMWFSCSDSNNSEYYCLIFLPFPIYVLRNKKWRQPHINIYNHTKHAMMDIPPGLKWLCPLYPWPGRRCPHLMAPLIPIDLCKASVIGFALTTVGSLVLGASKNRIKK